MSQRKEIAALKNLICETDQILATTPELPENRTARCRELLRSLGQQRLRRERCTTVTAQGVVYNAKARLRRHAVGKCTPVLLVETIAGLR